MKKVAVVFCFFVVSLPLLSQNGKKAGMIKGVDRAKKEIYVVYDPKTILKISDKLHVSIDNGFVNLEVVFPMQSMARCAITAKDVNKIDQLKDGMIVYYGLRADEIKKSGNVDKKKEYSAGDVQTTGDMEMVFCPAGNYMMGAVDGDKIAIANEKPKHKVTLDAFWLAKYEVTQEQYESVMGKNPSGPIKNPKFPVVNVNWYDAIEYCNVLSERNGLEPVYNIDKNGKDPKNQSFEDKLKWSVTMNRKANGFRLPTEAEWEYACRAGSDTMYYWGNSSDLKIIDQYALCGENSAGGYKETHENVSGQMQTKKTPLRSMRQVGTKKPNQWGLYDMIGNAWEWCYDWFNDRYFESKTENPVGVEMGKERVLRGGSIGEPVKIIRSSVRFRAEAHYRLGLYGFRVARSVSE